LAVTALLVLSSSWGGAWAIAFHVATDDHHDRAASDRARTRGLEIATHGHPHAEDTPAHSHPVVGSVASSVPARLSLLAPAMIGTVLDAARGTAAGRGSSPHAGPNHDPPQRASVSVLRI
jgi:hypothetical protein